MTVIKFSKYFLSCIICKRLALFLKKKSIVKRNYSEALFTLYIRFQSFSIPQLNDRGKTATEGKSWISLVSEDIPALKSWMKGTKSAVTRSCGFLGFREFLLFFVLHAVAEI